VVADDVQQQTRCRVGTFSPVAFQVPRSDSRSELALRFGISRTARTASHGVDQTLSRTADRLTPITPYRRAVRSFEVPAKQSNRLVIAMSPNPADANTPMSSASSRAPAIQPVQRSMSRSTPNVPWPPNGKMVPVTISVTVADDSDPAPACAITGVTSNEPLDVSDSTLTGPLSVSLRADRNGLGTGRSYSIAVTCTNASHLSATAVVSVAVPHDQR
jgi:hypothetical protein